MNLEKYGPKRKLSPTLGDPCPLCRRPFAAGDFTTLVRRTGSGRYANDGTEVHWECAVQLHEQAAAMRSA
jgi:hypothetical protein